MVYRLLADCLVLVHLAYIVFVVAGGALIEFTGWICPLTPWEQALRLRAGQVGYAGGFIAHYLLPILYPLGLTPAVQVALGLLVIGVNVAIYAFVGYRRTRAITVRCVR